MEIDHIFICTKEKAPEGDLLVDFGLAEGSSNIHLGQGTANRRFFFHNMMLELLWIENMDEAQSELTKPMRLYERCVSLKNECSPIGIGLRPSKNSDANISFPVWEYHPIYLPEFLSIQVAEDTHLSEPMYFYLSFAKRLDDDLMNNKEPLNHQLGYKEVTNIKIHVNQEVGLSKASRLVSQLDNVDIELDGESFIELEFDYLVFNEVKDFRPELPLVIRW